MSSNVAAYEKLGAFYLGRPYDLKSGETDPTPLLYDSKDLLTHAVCVGMTGSGKTGLCIALLEEAAIDGIPSLVIDVKGDLGNLLLTFPELSGEAFEPWVSAEEAQRQGQSVEQFAAARAELWRQGLGQWNQDEERLRRLREAADFAIYTPGSEAGLPISILTSFDAPPAVVRDDQDALQERIVTTVSSLLGLLGIDADPLRSREHILLSKLLEDRWSAGRNLDLSGLIQAIQDPPFPKVGVLSLDAFYPAKERFELAMALNNLLAAPGFQSWLSGVPLDLDRLLYTAEGKPRVAIVSIAHLADAERMFFVSLLLSQTLAWMRSRSGTTSLRAILCMDEVFGYLPPVAMPPSKTPLLTLLKQARAFGLGLLLATQNPADLDYKALSNIGTWFLGRLQTERDKARVLDGLESSAEGGISRGEYDRLLSGLDKRVFLMRNVHEDEPVTFYVRWVMSYLRGPLTRRQIKRLMDGRRGPEPGPATAPSPASPAAASSAAAAASAASGGRPVLPPGVTERFVPLAGRSRDAVVYQPRLLGAARVHFVDRRKSLEASEDVVFLAELPEDPAQLDWYDARQAELDPSDLERDPEPEARFSALPASAEAARNYKSWQKDFADMLYRERRVELRMCPAFDLISKPGESERDFRVRLAEAVREERDRQTDKLREKYARKMTTLEGRIERAEQKVQREQSQAQDHKFKSMVTIGSSILGAFLGRKKISAANVRRFGTAARGFSRGNKEARDVDLAEEQLAELREQVVELEQELENEIYELAGELESRAESFESFELKPRRTDIDVRLVALAWVPFRDASGGLEAAF